MRLKLKEMEIISAVAETHNISRAAVGLSMQQANVSKYISDLESRIGLKVFNRTSRTISLTDFGQALLPHINKQLQNQKGLNDFISDYKKIRNGTVTIYAPTVIMMFIANEIVPAIKNIGDISLSLKTYNPSNNQHNDGIDFPEDCDILFSYSMPKDDSLVSVLLSKGKAKLYASPSYLSTYPVDTPDKLQEYASILYHSLLINESNVWSFQMNEGEKKEIRVTGSFVCDNALTAIMLARNGLGVVITPEYPVSSHLEKNELVSCFEECCFVPYELVAIYRKREYQPLRVLFILDQFLTKIRDYTKNNGGI